MWEYGGDRGEWEGQPKESGREKPFGGLMTHKPTSDHTNCRDSRMGVKQKKGE